MSMPSHYEINVSLNGIHYFATAPRSGQIDQNKLQALVDDFRARFPQEEGFEITVTHWSCGGTKVSI